MVIQSLGDIVIKQSALFITQAMNLRSQISPQVSPRTCERICYYTANPTSLRKFISVLNRPYQVQ